MFRNTRALIVDHRLLDRLQLRQQLESLQIDVAEEGNGSRGADRALNERFDIIFLSSCLPIMRAGAVRDILRRSGITTPMVLIAAESSDWVGLSNCGDSTISRPVGLSELSRLLRQVVGHKVVAIQADPFAVDLAAMDEALESKDFDQLIALAQKLRDFSGEFGSEGLANSAERLEACLLEEHPQESHLTEIKATIAELGGLASSLKRNAPSVRGGSKHVPK